MRKPVTFVVVRFVWCWLVRCWLVCSRKCTFLNCILALFWREIQFCFRNQVGRLLEPSTPPTCNSYGSYRLSLFQAYCSWFCLRSKSVVDPFILWISFAGLSLLNTVNKYQQLGTWTPPPEISARISTWPFSHWSIFFLLCKFPYCIAVSVRQLLVLHTVMEKQGQALLWGKS